jgi:DNA-binding FadR family transcriptional regulator
MGDAAAFTRRRNRPLIEQVADHLRRRIVSGDIGPDRQLPSMRRLARMYGVSLPTMHAAIHSLAAVGFVRISHGLGTFVSRPRSAATVLIYACKEATPFELAAIRATIDQRMPIVAAQSVRAARNGRLPRHLEDLTFLASERSTSRNDGFAERFVRADLQFHQEIVANAKGVEVGESLYEHIGLRLMPQLTAAADDLAADIGLDEAHRELATAIIDGAVIPAARLAGAIARREADAVERVSADR